VAAQRFKYLLLVQALTQPLQTVNPFGLDVLVEVAAGAVMAHQDKTAGQVEETLHLAH
jgi:hypothetical protein